ERVEERTGEAPCLTDRLKGRVRRQRGSRGVRGELDIGRAVAGRDHDVTPAVQRLDAGVASMIVVVGQQVATRYHPRAVCVAAENVQSAESPPIGRTECREHAVPREEEILTDESWPAGGPQPVRLYERNRHESLAAGDLKFEARWKQTLQNG